MQARTRSRPGGRLASLVGVALLLSAAAAGAGSAADSPDRLVIRLPGLDLDPGSPPPLAAPVEGSDMWLVAHEGRSPAFLAVVASAGGAPLAPIPHAAYVVRAPGDAAVRLAAHPLTRWMTPWRPSFAISPEVARLLTSAAPQDHIPLVVVAAEFGSELVFRRVSVAPEELATRVAELAAAPGVLALTVAPRYRVQLTQSAWQLQTGIDMPGASDLDVTARLFAQGLTGEGLIVAVADTGLENDNCRFRYGPGDDDAAWPVVPGTFAGLPAEQDALDSLRTRLRKVVAYYVAPGATAYDDASHHGSIVASCVVGDDFATLAARPLVRDVGAQQNVPSHVSGGTWTFGQRLRPDLLDRVDDPGASEPAFPTTFGARVQHHQEGDGVAPGAQLVVQDLADDSGAFTGAFTPTRLLTLAHDTGATVHVAAFGGSPCVDCYLPAAEVDAVLWRRRDLVSVVSAGNSGLDGPMSILAGFAQAKNVVVVGGSERGNAPSAPPATRPGEDVWPRSSRGPKSGGRLAPDVMAPGVVEIPGYASVAPADGASPGDRDCGVVAASQGTSEAAPQIAGAALLVQQYFLDGFYPTGARTPAHALRPTSQLVRAVLANSARNMRGARTNDDGSGPGDRPSMGQGWGLPRLDDTLYFAGDPSTDDPRGDTERARLRVLADVPMGFDPASAAVRCPTALPPGSTRPVEAPEPGGLLRSHLLGAEQVGLQDSEIREFLLAVRNPDPTDPANELRITLAFTDVQSVDPQGTLVNDVDLEVVSPSGVVYRPDPLSAWLGGYTVPSPDGRTQAFDPVRGTFIDFPDRDPVNTLENVFVAPTEVEPGAWTVRVIAYLVSGIATASDAAPGYVLGDAACDLDADGDGTPDIDARDVISTSRQGFALLASGDIGTLPATLALDRSAYACRGDALVVTLTDENGDAPRNGCDPDGDGTPLADALDVTLTTTTPRASFPSDLEVEALLGAPPTFTTRPLPVVVVVDADDVVHGNGRIELLRGEEVIARHVDADPCGAAAAARARVDCAPAVEDAGFTIEGGCDLSVPSDPMSPVRPDDYMDAGEIILYAARVVPATSRTLHDLHVALTPDPADPVSAYLLVAPLSPRIGVAPPGRRSSATFRVVLGPRCATDCDPRDGSVDGIPPRHRLRMLVDVSSPRDGLPAFERFVHEHVLEADQQCCRYDTRDPNAELYGPGLIERDGDGGIVTNCPSWFDPDADCGGVPCSSACDVPRHLWPTTGGVPVPPAPCTTPSALTGNPWNPWDFNDSPEDFVEAGYEGDSNQPTTFAWRGGPSGGGCGWENELDDQLAGLPPGHPDRHAQPWGIWHTGRIGAAVAGWGSQGAPEYESPPGPPSPNEGSILWDSTPTGGADNTSGDWCDTYLSDVASYPSFYRLFLVPPRLHRVHRSSPEWTVTFEELRFHARLDAHRYDDDNYVAVGWLVSNDSVDPLSASPLTYSWAQYEHVALRYADLGWPDWRETANVLGDDLTEPDPSRPGQTFENLYGPASDAWDFALTWAHVNTRLPRNGRGQYGLGVDDVSFAWRECRETDDGTDCAASAGLPLVHWGASELHACDGELTVTVVDPARASPRIVACVSSSRERADVVALDLADAATGRYEAVVPFTTDGREDAAGRLLVSAGGDTLHVEYDPAEADGADAAEACDWSDVAPADGRNDDADGDGVPDAEDDPPGTRERAATASVHCPSGVIALVRHRLQQVPGTPGDGDRFADHGERAELALTLLSRLPYDLEDVEVTVSTRDTTACILVDAVRLDVLRTGMATETPLPGGLQVGVPLAVRTVSLDAPQTVTLRIDVSGTSTLDGAPFSTAGEGVRAPLDVRLILDVDESLTLGDYSDAPLLGRLPGQFLEGFEGAPGVLGHDHVFVNAIRAGNQPPISNDATTDTRQGMSSNDGFCPECDVNDGCQVPEDCGHYFMPDTGDPTRPGYPPARPVEWGLTNAWVKSGGGAYKFGRPNAGPSETDQRHSDGQFVSLELMPMRIASDPATVPELRFWHVADFATEPMPDGSVDPLGAGVLEISASTVGTGTNNANLAQIRQVFPASSFHRLTPVAGAYDAETTPGRPCSTFFCGGRHACFARQGSPTQTPPPGDPGAGAPGTPGTWREVVVDLSDYRGLEVVIRFTVAVPQGVRIPPGSYGWIVDDVSVTGLQRLATGPALRLQATDPSTVDPCVLIADFASAPGACPGEWLQVLDRHRGLGALVGGAPVPIEIEWLAGPIAIGPGAPEAPIVPAPLGVDGTSTFGSPRLDLVEAGLAPGRHPLTQRVHQGAMVASVTREVVLKDVPVVDLVLETPGPFAGGPARFSAAVAYDRAIDPDRAFTYLWDFDDGTAPSHEAPEVLHAFAAPGARTVRLTVTDDDGCSAGATLTVTVAPPPAFRCAGWRVVSACAEPASPGLGDGDADLGEHVAVEVDLRNDGAAAPHVVVVASSADPALEIRRGAADLGDVPAGATVTVPLAFVRRPVPGEDLTCVTAPLVLDLSARGGSFLQRLACPVALGGAIDVANEDADAGRAFCAAEELDPPFTSTAPAGCLDGLELDLRLTATNIATMDRLEITLETPDLRRVTVVRAGGGPHWTAVDVHFRFGSSDGDAPIADTGGVVEDLAGTLDDATEATLAADLAGTPMGGRWNLHVRDVAPGDCALGTYLVEVRAFWLEGTRAADLDVGVESACASCLLAAAPVAFDPQAACTAAPVASEGIVSWRPALDASTCGGVSDVTYELFASAVVGERGEAAVLLRSGDTCADCPAGATCAFVVDEPATWTTACDVESTYWTVVAVDGTPPRPRTPDASGATDPVSLDLQTELRPCSTLPLGSMIRVRASAGRLLIEVPEPNPAARGFRILRGTFPTDPATGRMELLSWRPAPYDHVAVTCESPGLVHDVSADLGSRQAFYYLLGTVNAAGCAGLGYQATPAPWARHVLEHVAPRPSGSDACPGGACAP